MRKLIVLIVTVLLWCPASSWAGEGERKGGDANEATTVKSGKSNSSDRVAAPDDKKSEPAGASEGTTKSSKSNSSE